MTVRLFCIMLTAILLTAVLCACGGEKTPEQTAPTASPGAPTQAHQEVSVPDYVPQDGVEEQAQLVAMELLEQLNAVDKLGGGALDVDEKDSFEQDLAVYCRVTDPRFDSVSDVRSFMTSVLTPECISNRYASILDAQLPYFIERDGKLYYKQAARGCGFTYAGKPAVDNMTDDSFVAVQTYDNYGSPGTMRVTVSSAPNGWRISDIAFFAADTV